MVFRRKVYDELDRRLREPRRFLQVVLGPRQTGKTTGLRDVLAGWGERALYDTADDPGSRPPDWVERTWRAGRELAKNGPALLALDEVQKVRDWSEIVKRLWDEDTASKLPLHVVLLGSSTLLLQAGLGDSLAGRFEILRATHWSLDEMEAEFGFDVDRFVHFGGYPGAVAHVGDEPRWRAYVLDSLVETCLSRDIFLVTRVDKPALLRRLFHLACSYSGQVLSYQKMVGQLQDAGNTTTLAHYLDLLSSAGLVQGLSKFAGETFRQRASSPKLLALNTALVSAFAHLSLAEVRSDPERWGRRVETAVGAHLVNTSLGTGVEVFWWREGHFEVDYVLQRGSRRVAIEVKTGARAARREGLAAFQKAFGPCTTLIVGTGGIDVGDFLRRPAPDWLES